jgi:hypothetical protein
VRLGGAGTQTPGKTIAVAVRCSEPCSVTATGTLSVTTPATKKAKKRTRRFTLAGPKRIRLAAGRTVTLRLRIPDAARLLLGRKGARGVATISIVSSDAAGNKRRSKRTVKVRLRR